MRVRPTELPGVTRIELRTFADDRGFFVERFQAERFRELGLPVRFAQDNHSRSRPGVLRGMHLQLDPPQGKLVSVLRGRIFDVTVDLRPDSSAFGKWQRLELRDDVAELLWVPAGVAHGFCVLGDEPADVTYKTDALYSPATEIGFLWSDPDLGIAWPISSPVLSKRDAALPSFRNLVRRWPRAPEAAAPTAS